MLAAPSPIRRWNGARSRLDPRPAHHVYQQNAQTIVWCPVPQGPKLTETGNAFAIQMSKLVPGPARRRGVGRNRVQLLHPVSLATLLVVCKCDGISEDSAGLWSICWVGTPHIAPDIFALRRVNSVHTRVHEVYM